jgi:hypothetical protein
VALLRASCLRAVDRCTSSPRHSKQLQVHIPFRGLSDIPVRTRVDWYGSRLRQTNRRQSTRVRQTQGTTCIHPITQGYMRVHADTCGNIPIYVSVCIHVIPPVSACTRFVIMHSPVWCIPVFTCRLHYQADFRVKRHGSSCIRMCALNLEMYSGVSACDRLESA